MQRRILSYVLFLYFSLSVCACLCIVCLCLFVKVSVQRICLLQSKKTQYKRTRNNLTNIYYSYTHTSWRMNNICYSFFFRCWYPLSLLLGIHTKHSLRQWNLDVQEIPLLKVCLALLDVFNSMCVRVYVKHMYVCVYVCSLTRPTKLYVHKSALFHLLYTTTDTFCCFLFLIHSIQFQIRLTAIKLFLLLLLLAFVSIPVVLLFLTFSCIFLCYFLRSLYSFIREI